MRIVTAAALDVCLSPGYIEADRPPIHAVKVARDESNAFRRDRSLLERIIPQWVGNVEGVAVKEIAARHRPRLRNAAIVANHADRGMDAGILIGECGTQSQRRTIQCAIGDVGEIAPEVRG